LCREEASGLSSLKPQLDAHNVKLYGVVHEDRGVKEFQPFFDGEIFLDSERRFYGPRERWMLWSALVRPSVWRAIFRARGKNIEGNMKGEGRLLGGVFVVSPGDSGVLLDHKESEFGDHANVTDIMDAVQKMRKE
jgi:hypothetical protein